MLREVAILRSAAPRGIPEARTSGRVARLSEVDHDVVMGRGCRGRVLSWSVSSVIVVMVGRSMRMMMLVGGVGDAVVQL